MSKKPDSTNSSKSSGKIESERERRWRLVLGKPADECFGGAGGLGGDDANMDRVLDALYDSDRRAGLGSSAPKVSRWLGDIRTYFPSSVVRVMQQDAFEKFGLQQLLTEPEMLEMVEPDVHLVANLISLSRVIPEKTKDTARQVVRRVVEDLERRLLNPMASAVKGALNKATRNNRPKFNEIDWDRTIRKNLKNYQPETGAIIAERFVGYGRKQSSLRDIVLCIDQSGSMASSVVYAAIFGAVLASIRAVSTRMIVFDTAVVDLTEDLKDPVDLLFGTQLGGGTDINKALGYCQTVIDRPAQTILVLISDLYEGGNEREMLKRAAQLVQSGVQMIALLALSDDGSPMFDHRVAAEYANMGIPSFACTPDQFPGLMAAAIQRQDINQWAARQDIVTARAKR